MTFTSVGSLPWSSDYYANSGGSIPCSGYKYAMVLTASAPNGSISCSIGTTVNVEIDISDVDIITYGISAHTTELATLKIKLYN